jgi:hypothetical protein
MILANMLQLVFLIGSSPIARGEGPWWNFVPEELRLIFSLVLFLVNLIVLAIVLYLAGLIVVGGKRALPMDAFLISLLGTVISTVLFMFIPYSLLALILSMIAWLLLIKRFYETGWFGAIAVGILAIIVFLVVTVIIALLFGILTVIIERFLPFLTLAF